MIGSRSFTPISKFARHQIARKAMSTASKSALGKKLPPVPRPSASILLISSTNQVLLLHRVKSSTSFPSAHVFPGGNLSEEQDGEIPGVNDPGRHENSAVYRLGAIRECFEESGILLARRSNAQDNLLELTDEEREDGRHAIHDNSAKFQHWLKGKGGVPDTESLIPFTRWVTPTNIPKRFTTQMYLYFLPLPSQTPPSITGTLSVKSEAIIPNPTSDGGIEHTAARFLPPSTWLSMARSSEIILPPPQHFLLHLLTKFFSPENVPNTVDPAELGRQRDLVIDFVRSGDPPWTDMCISPSVLPRKQTDGRAVFALDKPGLELEGSGRRGDSERVMLVRFRKEGPRDVEVVWKKDILQEDRERREKL